MVADTRLYLFSDGKIGHAKQARALSAYAEHRTEEFVLSLPAPARLLAPHFAGVASRFLSAQMRSLDSGIAVGVGRQAAVALRALRSARLHTIQVLYPGVGTRHFDRMVLPRHDARTGSSVVLIEGSLHRVDDEFLATARDRWENRFAQLPAPRIALLVGGSSPYASVEPGWIQRLLPELKERAGSLLVSTSRRTGAELRRAIRAELVDFPHHFFEAEPGVQDNPYPGYLGCADGFVVSPDSVNMISEALGVGLAVASDAGQTRGKLRRFHDQLRERGLLTDVRGLLPGKRQTPLREAQRIVAEGLLEF